MDPLEIISDFVILSGAKNPVSGYNYVMDSSVALLPQNDTLLFIFKRSPYRLD
jgi:hypothetical protein